LQHFFFVLIRLPVAICDTVGKVAGSVRYP